MEPLEKSYLELSVISVKSQMPSFLLVTTGHCQVVWSLSPQLWFGFLGIYYKPDCSSTDLDHAVLVIGYGFDGAEKANRKYWRIKNR
jgi:hypothetical protein